MPVDILDQDKVRRQLARHGLTQKAFARSVGLTEEGLCKALQPGHPARVDTVMRIAVGLERAASTTRQKKAATPTASGAAAQLEGGVTSARLQEEHRVQTTEPRAEA